MSALTHEQIGGLWRTVELIEAKNTKIDELNGDKKEIYERAKNEYRLDTRAVKAVIADRAKASKDPKAHREAGELLETYLAAMSEPPAPNKRTTDVPRPAVVPSNNSLARVRGTGERSCLAPIRSSVGAGADSDTALPARPNLSSPVTTASPGDGNLVATTATLSIPGDLSIPKFLSREEA
jgi:uncharacterized protein (UPF0335 family)